MIYTKDRFVSVPLCLIVDMIENAFGIRSTITAATDTELEDTIATSSNTDDLENEKASSQFENPPSCIICDLDHDYIVSNLLHQTESSDTDDWKIDTESFKIRDKVFAEGAILSNPITELTIGLLTTVLVQSSSTSTSIVISMVSSSSKIRDKVFAEGAILSNPITELMIGLLTTVLVQSSSTSTSIVISMGKREEFCLAFTGATVHDMFNWLTVLILLLIEITSNMLYHLTNPITKSINLKRNPNSNPQFLTVITKSLTERIVQVCYFR
ncbi:unnamed protein product [Rotaria sp. Silwood2]|nr:unnamed protein product [Rotaria sp. Silwood2]